MVARTSSILALAAIVVTSGAWAADPEPSEPKDEKICRTEKVTGTRSRVNRICMTAAEWDQLRRNTRRDIEKLQRNSSTPGAPLGSGPQ